MSTIPLLFFFNDTATTEIYTLSLHDALPICSMPRLGHDRDTDQVEDAQHDGDRVPNRGLEGHGDIPYGDHRLLASNACHADRKSTRLYSSHLVISYTIICL